MNCKDCKYNYIMQTRNRNVCKITSIGGRKGCNIESDENIPNMKICYNCQFWIGNGDFGLSCSRNYDLATTDGFRKPCGLYTKMWYRE